MSLGCSTDAFLLLPGAVLLHSGLLTAALLLGAGLGLLTAALLHTFLFKPLLITKKFKGFDPWSLLEVEEKDEERDEETESSSAERKTVQSETVKPVDQVNSDAAAFALKAKVIYPINQKYRPLADGTSNPSLHENPRPVVPPDLNSGSSSTDWSSHEREDNESSQDCGPVPTTQPSLTFRRAHTHPHSLCYTGAEGKLSLLCVTLQNLHQHMTQLQQEKWSMFLQVLRVLDREDSTLHQEIQQQEKEIEQMRKEARPDLLSLEKVEESGSVICSSEEVEKAGREKVEHILHTALRFAKQLEKFCQRLHSCCLNEAAQEKTQSLMHCLLLMEKQLMDIQTSFMKALFDRQQWWQELSGWLRLRMTLLRREAELRVRLTTQSLEELTADGQLDFTHMEQLSSNLHVAVSEELQRHGNDVAQQTVELVCEQRRKLDVKTKKMMKTQAGEWNSTLESHDQLKNIQQLSELFGELQVKHWKQRMSVELQWDRRVSEAICELWKMLFQGFSGSLTELWRESVLSALTVSSALSVDNCRTLLDDTDLKLTSLIQQEKNLTHQHLHTLQEQLERDKQIWTEEEALAKFCLKHLTNQHMKVAVATISRQSDIQDKSLIEDKQRLLVVEIQRILAARHFYIQTLKQMTLSQFPDTQSLQLEYLSELETATELLEENAHFLIGHALAHSTRMRLVDFALDNVATTNDKQKEQLKKAVCESVYVTRDGVAALIKNYYAQLRTIVMATQYTQQQPHSTMSEKQQERRECVSALKRELSNWTRKPNSAEFFRRVEQQKRRWLSQCEKEGICKNQGQTTDLQHQMHNCREELRMEEDRFLFRLAALARVPLMDTQINSLAGAEMDSLPREGSICSQYHTYSLTNTEGCERRMPRRREMLQS